MNCRLIRVLGTHDFFFFKENYEIRRKSNDRKGPNTGAKGFSAFPGSMTLGSFFH